MRMRVFVCVFICVRVRVRVRNVFISVRAYICASTGWSAWLRMRMRSGRRACVYVNVRVYACACMRACARVCVRVRLRA